MSFRLKRSGMNKSFINEKKNDFVKQGFLDYTSFHSK